MHGRKIENFEIIDNSTHKFVMHFFVSLCIETSIILLNDFLGANFLECMYFDLYTLRLARGLPRR